MHSHKYIINALYVVLIYNMYILKLHTQVYMQYFKMEGPNSSIFI